MISHGIQEPVPTALGRVLRRAVLDHARSEPRRVYPPLLHVGRPDAEETAFPGSLEVAGDEALRVAVLEAMLVRVGPLPGTPLVWLTRRGDLALEDVDAAWSAAARRTSAELASPIDFVVVNRRAWRDPVTGVGREWRRLRPRR